MKKLAIVITHPIQYYSPLFRLIAARKKIEIKVFYTWFGSQEKVYDKKFGREIKWDIPLLDGYEYTFVENISKNPGSGTFRGVENPDLIPSIKKWKAEAVLVFGWNHRSHLAVMRYFKGKIPVYFRGDSTLIDEKKNLKTFIRRIGLQFIYRYVDKAFYVGTHNRDYFLKHGLKENQLCFAPHAIDNNRFQRDEEKYILMAKRIKQEHHISSTCPIVLFVGKFEEKKNPLLLIEAAKQRPDCLFLFVGNGILEKSMREESGANCRFLPFQNQSLMPAVYRLSDIFVLPSKGPGETWGLAVNEAMACGKAVLVSDKVGCAPDLVRKDNGCVFASENLEDLLRKLDFLLPKAEKFGKNSKEHIKNWSFEQIAEALEGSLNK